MLTPTKLSDFKSHRIILAAVDGDGRSARRRGIELMSSIRREVPIYQCTNSHDSAQSILDAILGFDPIKLQDIQDELDWISTTNHNFFFTLLRSPGRRR